MSTPSAVQAALQRPVSAFTDGVAPYGLVSDRPFVVRRRVPFGDCDPAGIAYTPRLADHLVRAVHTLLEARPGGSAVEFGIVPPARSLPLGFLKPLGWDDEYNARVDVERLGNSAMTFGVEARRADGQLAFSGRLTLVAAHPREQALSALPRRSGKRCSLTFVTAPMQRSKQRSCNQQRKLQFEISPVM